MECNTILKVEKKPLPTYLSTLVQTHTILYSEGMEYNKYG